MEYTLGGQIKMQQIQRKQLLVQYWVINFEKLRLQERNWDSTVQLTPDNSNPR